MLLWIIAFLFCNAVHSRLNNDVSISTENYQKIKQKYSVARNDKKLQKFVLEQVTKLIQSDIEKIAKRYAAKSTVDADDIKSAMFLQLPSIFRNAMIKMRENNEDIEQETILFNSYIFKALSNTAKYFVYEERTKGLSVAGKILYSEWGKIELENGGIGKESDIHSNETKEKLKIRYDAWLESLRSAKVGKLSPLSSARERSRKINFKFYYEELVNFLQTSAMSSFDDTFQSGESKADKFQGQLGNQITFGRNKIAYWDRYTDAEKSIILDSIDSRKRLKYVFFLMMADIAATEGRNPLSKVGAFFGISEDIARITKQNILQTFEKLLMSPRQPENPKWNSLDWNQKLKVITLTATFALELYKKGFPDPFIDDLIERIKKGKTLPETVIDIKEKFLDYFWGRFSPEQQCMLLDPKNKFNQRYVKILQKADEALKYGIPGNKAVAELEDIHIDKASRLLSSAVVSAQKKVANFLSNK